MQQGPNRLHEILNELIDLVKDGNGNKRCEIKNSIIKYHDPHVQKLNQSVNSFKSNPSPDSFSSIKTAILDCQLNNINGYNYQALNSHIAEIEALTTPPRSPQRRSKP